MTDPSYVERKLLALIAGDRPYEALRVKAQELIQVLGRERTYLIFESLIGRFNYESLEKPREKLIARVLDGILGWGSEELL